MARVNQRGEPVVKETLFPFGSNTSDDDVREAISLLCDHLGVRIIKTNATKSGHTEVELVVNSPAT